MDLSLAWGVKQTCFWNEVGLKRTSAFPLEGLWHMLYILILHTKTALIAHMHLMGCQSRHIESFLRASQHFKVPVHFESLNRQSYTILQMYIQILANNALSLSPFQCTCSSTLENLIKTRFHILYPISGSPDPPSDTMRPPRPGSTGRSHRVVLDPLLAFHMFVHVRL